MFPLIFLIVVEISLDIDLHYSMLYNLFSNTGSTFMSMSE